MSPMLDEDEDARLQRRQRRLLTFVYASTMIPLLVFALLTWQSIDLAREMEAAQAKLTTINADLQKKQKQLAETERALVSQKKATTQYRDAAGVKIRFYRESDRAMVQRALIDQGFKVDAALGTSRTLQNAPVNTLSYGSSVAREDLRAIAVALVGNGLALTRIAPAVKQPDPSLIQIIASGESRDNCGLLTVEMLKEIDFTSREICGPK